MSHKIEDKNGLPQGWIKAKLGEVCEVLDSKRVPINSDERAKRIIGKVKTELFPYYGATGLVGYIDDFLFDGEYVLLGEDGAPFLESFKDKAYLAKGKFWVNNHAHILNALFSNTYLCHYLNQIDYGEFVTGTTRLKLNQASMKEIPITLPPLREQNRIVAKIEELFSELDKGVDALKTAQQQLKVYRQAVLKWAFEGKLTEEWRKQRKDIPSASQLLEQIKAEREKQVKTNKKTLKHVPLMTEMELAELPTLPGVWCWVKMGEVTSDVQYGTSSKSKEKGKLVVIRMGNIQNFRIRWDDLQYTDDEKEIKKYLLGRDDVLFNRTNSPELVGKSAIYKGEMPAIFAGYLIRLNQLAPLVNPDFLNYFLNSHIAKEHGNSVKTDGVNQSNINGTKLGNYPFPYCSLKEQNQIVQEIETRLSVADKLEENIEQSLKHSSALRQSILKKAFEGKLVPQDPNDEPASKLLERIKVEKAAQATVKGTVSGRGKLI